MNRCFFVLLLLAAVAAASNIGRFGKPHYLDCTDSSDCGSHECCVFLGSGMYSIPRCELIIGIWGRCNSKQQAQGSRRNVTYPDHRVVEFVNVYDLRCPCEIGLQCDSQLDVCLDPSDREDFNDIGMK